MALAYPHHYKTPLSKVILRVDDQWVDCTVWRHSHPGGTQLIDQFHQSDATDAFYAFHSKDAIDKLKKMKNVGDPSGEGDHTPTERDALSVNFDNFRKELEQKGYFTRYWIIDFVTSILPVLVMLTLGTYLSTTRPVWASILIGVAMQQAGWIGHDYSHGRGPMSAFLGLTLGALINGFSTKWWGNKHNAHHSFPNRKEYDSDIDMAPVLHLWKPEPSKDVWWRRYQHYYYPIAYSFLYFSWRMQSIGYVLGSRNWTERTLIAINYILLAMLPWYVALASIFIGGFLVAVVVTANHQTEEMLEPNSDYHFVRDQFITTRGVACPDPVTEYLFGGMQYQLEHHLFPIMPRYYYPAVRPLVKKFAKENGLQFHVSGMAEIVYLNYAVMRDVAMA